ncbi:hypothetical protein ACFXKC_44460 [Streptomyces sp. NPDC059340]|uniref:hypothetical protein n=1 Tax=Streptomyces TaxID=1883 RepID=UPI00117C84FF|nr:hypothetical protein [Streptomyces sp. OK228]
MPGSVLHRGHGPDPADHVTASPWGIVLVVGRADLSDGDPELLELNVDRYWPGILDLIDLILDKAGARQL